MISNKFKNTVGQGKAFLAGVAMALTFGSAPAVAGPILTEYDLDNDGNVDSVRWGDQVFFSGGELPKYSEAAAITNVLGVEGFSVVTEAQLPTLLNLITSEFGDLYGSTLMFSPDSTHFWALGGRYYDTDTGTFNVSNNSDDVANAPLVVTLKNQTVPEPGTFGLAGLALAGLAGAGAATRRRETTNAPRMAA